jgi:predicted MFS family arabinose efflux permease
MSLAARRIAVGLAGFCAFLNLYSPQSLLPTLAQEFGVGAADISLMMTATAVAVGMTAPFSGAAADVLGRKRIITVAMALLAVPTVMLALSPDVPTLVFWRFVQGLMLPPIFVVTIAYIGEEWPLAEVAGATGIYTAGASVGGFGGRFLTGILTDLVGWRFAFASLAVFALAAAVAVMVMLPRERGFKRSESLIASLRQMMRHFRNRHLIATYAVGFGVLFNFIATFTYVTFVLAAPPYELSPALLGAIFAVYLVGTFLAPMVGIALSRWGRRNCVIAALLLWIGGILLTLVPSLAVIIVGLAVCAGCGLIVQTISTGYVAITATEGRSSAIGLYVLSFYIGGSVGAYLPGLAYEAAGWWACVAFVAGMLVLMASVVALFWTSVAKRA